MLTKKEKESWFLDIRCGNIYCPMRGCTWAFFTSFELASHLLGDCKFGSYSDVIPCTHCHVELKFEALKFHWRKCHRDIVMILAKLYQGEKCHCLNYQCKKVFYGGFEQCKEFTKHTITCSPLFICKQCKMEYSNTASLKLHNCSGTVKRQARKSISKLEKGIDRDISKRPAMDIKQEKDHISQWKAAFADGKLTCPVPSCEKKFYVPNHFNSHLEKESKLDQIFLRISTIKCMFCCTEINWKVWHRHMQNNHREIVNFLNQLKTGGVNVQCPNYLCVEKASFTFDTGYDYLIHALTCKPLFHCYTCGTDSRYQKYINNHKCGEQPIKLKHRPRDIKTKSECGTPESFVKKELDDTSKKIPQGVSAVNLTRLKSKPSKRIGYGAGSCTVTKVQNLSSVKTRVNDTINTPDIQIESGPHVTTPKNRKTELDNSCVHNRSVQSTSKNLTHVKRKSQVNGESFCNQRSVSGANRFSRNRQRNRAEIVDTTPTEFSTGTSDEEPSVNFNGLFTPVVIRSDEPSENYSELLRRFSKRKDMRKNTPEQPSSHIGQLTSQNHKKQSTATDDDTDELPASVVQKIQKHLIGEKRSQQSIQMLTKEWQKDFAKGLWRCIYPKCTDVFALPQAFQKHLLSYSTGDKLRKHIFSSTTSKLTCCFCQTTTTIQGMVRHSKKHQKYFQAVIEDNLVCPFEKCQEKFTESTLYLQHVCSCPIEMKDRDEEKEEERRKALCAKWQANFTSGVFVCGNEKCNKIFNVPQDLVYHLQTCQVDCINELIREKQDIVCPWCNELVCFNTFHVHFIDTHKQIYQVVSMENNEKYNCPNFNCPFVGYSLNSYQQHSVVCPPCLMCDDCRCTFTLYNQLSTHQCLANDPLFVKTSLSMWHNQVRSGLLRCPNPSCTSSFSQYDDFTTHLSLCARKSKLCQVVLDKNKICCSFCGVEKDFGNITEHCEKEHPEVFEMLERLKIAGKKVACENYKCNAHFVDSVKYFHHASICKPLYRCESCENEFSGKRQYNDHVCMRQNSVTDKRKKEERQVANQLNDWYNEIKCGTFTCPNVRCKQVFSTYDTLIPHIKTCKIDKTCDKAVNDDKFFCCFCKDEIALSMFSVHMDRSHPQIALKLRQLEYTNNITCIKPGCRQVFSDHGNFIQHIIRCRLHAEQPEQDDTSATKSQRFELSVWLEDLSNGKLKCPNKECSQDFFIIENFISHLKHCKVSKRTVNHASVGYEQFLPCLICKKEFKAKDLATHFRTEHTVSFAQLRLVSQGICIHCPIEDCKQAFVDGCAYLKHISAGCLLRRKHSCKDCEKRFPTHQDLDEHVCCRKENTTGSHDQVFDKLTQRSWYQDVMRGNLHCPNKDCNCEFVLPRDFVTHLRVCSEGNESSMILKRNELPCCFCKDYVSLGKYCSHLKTCHQEKAKQVSQAVSSSTTASRTSISSCASLGLSSTTLTSSCTSVGLSSTVKRKRGRPRKDQTPKKYNATIENENNNDTHLQDTFPGEELQNVIENRVSSLDETESCRSDNEDGNHAGDEPNTGAVSDDFLKDYHTSKNDPTNLQKTAEMTDATTIRIDDITIEMPSDDAGEDHAIDLNISSSSHVPQEDATTKDHVGLSAMKDVDDVSSEKMQSLDTRSKLKTKLKKRSQDRYKKRLTDDKEVIDLVSELLKKKRKKMHFSHRSSISASSKTSTTGQWTVTEKPKRIKLEEEPLHSPMFVSPQISNHSEETVTLTLEGTSNDTNQFEVAKPDKCEQGTSNHSEGMVKPALEDTSNDTSQFEGARPDKCEQGTSNHSEGMATPALEDTSNDTSQFEEGKPDKCEQETSNHSEGMATPALEDTSNDTNQFKGPVSDECGKRTSAKGKFDEEAFAVSDTIVSNVTSIHDKRTSTSTFVADLKEHKKCGTIKSTKVPHQEHSGLPSNLKPTTTGYLESNAQKKQRDNKKKHTLNGDRVTGRLTRGSLNKYKEDVPQEKIKKLKYNLNENEEALPQKEGKKLKSKDPLEHCNAFKGKNRALRSSRKLSSSQTSSEEKVEYPSTKTDAEFNSITTRTTPLRFITEQSTPTVQGKDSEILSKCSQQKIDIETKNNVPPKETKEKGNDKYFGTGIRHTEEAEEIEEKKDSDQIEQQQESPAQQKDLQRREDNIVGEARIITEAAHFVTEVAHVANTLRSEEGLTKNNDGNIEHDVSPLKNSTQINNVEYGPGVHQSLHAESDQDTCEDSGDNMSIELIEEDQSFAENEFPVESPENDVIHVIKVEDVSSEQSEQIDILGETPNIFETKQQTPPRDDVEELKSDNLSEQLDVIEVKYGEQQSCSELDANIVNVDIEQQDFENSKLDEDVTITNSKLDEDVTITNSKLDEDVTITNSKLDEDVSITNSKLDEDVTITNSKLDEDVTIREENIAQHTDVVLGEQNLTCDDKNEFKQNKSSLETRHHSESDQDKYNRGDDTNIQFVLRNQSTVENEVPVISPKDDVIHVINLDDTCIEQSAQNDVLNETTSSLDRKKQIASKDDSKKFKSDTLLEQDCVLQRTSVNETNMVESAIKEERTSQMSVKKESIVADTKKPLSRRFKYARGKRNRTPSRTDNNITKTSNTVQHSVINHDTAYEAPQISTQPLTKNNDEEKQSELIPSQHNPNVDTEADIHQSRNVGYIQDGFDESEINSGELEVTMPKIQGNDIKENDNIIQGKDNTIKGSDNTINENVGIIQRMDDTTQGLIKHVSRLESTPSLDVSDIDFCVEPGSVMTDLDRSVTDDEIEIISEVQAENFSSKNFLVSQQESSDDKKAKAAGEQQTSSTHSNENAVKPIEDISMIAMKELFSLMSPQPTVEPRQAKEEHSPSSSRSKSPSVEVTMESELQQRPPGQQQQGQEQPEQRPQQELEQHHGALSGSDDDKNELLQFEEGQAIENELQDLLSLVNDDDVQQFDHEIETTTDSSLDDTSNGNTMVKTVNSGTDSQCTAENVDNNLPCTREDVDTGTDLSSTDEITVGTILTLVDKIAINTPFVTTTTGDLQGLTEQAEANYSSSSQNQTTEYLATVDEDSRHVNNKLCDQINLTLPGGFNTCSDVKNVLIQLDEAKSLSLKGSSPPSSSPSTAATDMDKENQVENAIPFSREGIDLKQHEVAQRRTKRNIADEAATSSPKKIKRYDCDERVGQSLHMSPSIGDLNITKFLTRDINTSIDIVKTDVTRREAVVFIETIKEKMTIEEWCSNITKFNFVCPRCAMVTFRMTSLVKHMKSCMKQYGVQEYLAVKITCPECHFNNTIERLIYHFRTKHLLLHWYFGEIEKGNWAICQNYACAKYMDQVDDICEHTRRCGYLWKCKYCHVEYEKESVVRKHRCRDSVTSSEEENNNDDDDNDHDDDDNKCDEDDEEVSRHNNDNYLGNRKKSRRESRKGRVNVQNNEKINFKTNIKSDGIEACIGLDNITTVDKNNDPGDVKIFERSAVSDNFTTVERNTDLNNGLTSEKNVCLDNVTATGLEHCEEENVMPPLDHSVNMEKSDKSSLDEDNNAVPKSSTKKNKRKKSPQRDHGSEIDYKEWAGEISQLHFTCRISGCLYNTLNGFKRHITKTHDRRMADVLCSIPITCPVETCSSEKQSKLNLDGFVLHLRANHLPLWNNTKTFESNKQVNCSNYTCNEILNNVQEILEHYVRCKFKWKCDFCSKELLSEQGVKQHKCEEKQQRKERSPSPEQGVDDVNHVTSTKRTKRKSAARALDLISTVEDSLDKETIKHYNKKRKKADSDEEFNGAGAGSSDTESEEYLNDDDDNEEDDDEIQTDHSVVSLSDDELDVFRPSKVAPYVDDEFFQQWLRENRSDVVIFPEFLPSADDLHVLDESAYRTFLPYSHSSPYIEIDYRTSRGKTTTPLTKLELFQPIPPLEGSTTLGFYCGGPVWGMDWCPADGAADQYLAVTCNNSFAQRHCVVDSEAVQGLIQIWSFRSLNKNPECKLAFGFCHNYGPIYEIKWCPETYTHEKEEIKDRLGLLAAACGDGYVRIFCVPRPEDSDPVFGFLNPCAVLSPRKKDVFESNRTGYCLCLSWQPVLHHGRIAAGFGDGNVCIWDVSTKSQFLRTEENNIQVVLPIITIFAHSYAVRSIAWCPYNKEIIATASADKSSKIFNINQPYTPIYVIKRGIHFSFEWPKKRLGVFACEDDCFNIIPSSARYLVLEFFIKMLTKEDPKRALPTSRHLGAVWSCSYNNHLDLIATGDALGEVVVIKDVDSQGTKTYLLKKRTEPVYHIERIRIEDDPPSNDICDGEDREISNSFDADDDDDNFNLLEDYKAQCKDHLKSFYRYKYKIIDSNNFEFSKTRRNNDADIVRVCNSSLKNHPDFTDLETRSINKALMAWCASLESSIKVSDYPDTFFPYYATYLLSVDFFEFCNCLWIVLVLWNENLGSHTWLATGTRFGIVRLHNFKAWKR